MPFISWQTEIKKRLESGSIKNIVIFGDIRDIPAPPYVVIKFARSEMEGISLVQCFIHAVIGMKDMVEGYALRELPKLFSYPLKNEYACILLRDARVYIPDLAISDDGTISAERDFYLPYVM